MAERLYPVVYDFLVGCGFSKTATKCLKEMKKTEADLKTSESLIKLYQVYLDKSKSAVPVQKLTGLKRQATEEESDSEDDSDSEESEPVKKVETKKEVATKKSVKEVKKVVESSDESSEEESEEEDEEDDDSEEDSSDEEADNAATLARIKLKEEERKKKAIEASEAAAAWTEVISFADYRSAPL